MDGSLGDNHLLYLFFIFFVCIGILHHGPFFQESRMHANAAYTSSHDVEKKSENSKDDKS